MKKLIIHIPHASTHFPFKTGFVVDDTTLEKEVLKLTDWYTDELFHSDKDIIVAARFSRVFCDVERFPEDHNEVMAKYGMGVLYTRCDDGTLIRILNDQLRRRIINDYYWEHHKKLAEAVSSQLKDHGAALIIDAHSFPEKPFYRDLIQDLNRPDLNIGTDAFHTPDALSEFSMNFFKERGYTVEINRPYSGTIVPAPFYCKNPKVHSIMLEVNRRLYLENGNEKKLEKFEKIKKIINEYFGKVLDFY